MELRKKAGSQVNAYMNDVRYRSSPLQAREIQLNDKESIILHCYRVRGDAEVEVEQLLPVVRQRQTEVRTLSSGRKLQAQLLTTHLYTTTTPCTCTESIREWK
jgi:hypothetical protein